MINQVVILAAGDGRRMLPLTEKTPKLLLKVAGKPLVDYILEGVKELGITDVVFVIGYLKDQIIAYLSDYHGLNIHFAEQNKKLGTAHAVGLSEPYITGDFLVLNGDVLFEKKAIGKLISEHKNHELNIVSEEVEDARPYGVLFLKDGKIVDLIEKPENPPTNLINAGFYVFPKQIFGAIKETTLSERGEYEITDSIRILIKKGITARPIPYIGKRIELTRPTDINRATKWIESN
jgi:UDP-N-acetylglucosamine diphosphorylase / glucose-1-phosphate thymidylyltransferase / UDP-N-acetylgalactosamine diphosphorylase / glucosamine-1-phosphate N-acetyltransferase / galactosamine-1-phosphate N-acetyltransferase